MMHLRNFAMMFRLVCDTTLVVVAVALGGASAAAQPIYFQGHGDIGVAYEDGALDLHYHLDSSAAAEGGEAIGDGEFSPSGIFTRVPDPSTPRPLGAQWNFTGTAAASPVWILPQTSDPNRPFLGFGTEELDPSEWSGPITLALTGVVAAPAGGEFSLWQTDLFGAPTRLWDTQDGDFGNDLFNLVVGGHDHATFGFTMPGIYQLELTATAHHLTDGLVTSSGVFTFLVGDGTLPPQAPTSPDAVPEPGTLAGMLIAAAVGAAVWRKCRRTRRLAATVPREVSRI
jgi:surface-anchored protein